MDGNCSTSKLFRKTSTIDERYSLIEGEIFQIVFQFVVQFPFVKRHNYVIKFLESDAKDKKLRQIFSCKNIF